MPWLMTVGDTEAVLNPSSLVRYHYSNQHKNWHMPNDYYTVTYKFGSNLTLANGMYEETTFNVTILNINTWDLLLGNPIGNHLTREKTRIPSASVVRAVLYMGQTGLKQSSQGHEIRSWRKISDRSRCVCGPQSPGR